MTLSLNKTEQEKEVQQGVVTFDLVSIFLGEILCLLRNTAMAYKTLSS